MNFDIVCANGAVQTPVKGDQRETFRIVGGKVKTTMGQGGDRNIRRFLTGDEH